MIGLAGCFEDSPCYNRYLVSLFLCTAEYYSTITFQIEEHLSYFYFLFFQTLLFIRPTASIGAQAMFYIQSKSLGMALGISAMC